MSDAVVITLIVMVGLVLIALIGLGAWVFVQRQERPVKAWGAVSGGPFQKPSERSYEKTGGYASAPEPPTSLPKVDGGPGPGSKVERTYGGSGSADYVEPPLEADNEPKAEVPIPVHPEIEPRWRVYKPISGHEPRSCDCHQDPLYDGQPVLWWTRPDHSVLLFCVRTFPLPKGMLPQ